MQCSARDKERGVSVARMPIVLLETNLPNERFSEEFHLALSKCVANTFHKPESVSGSILRGGRPASRGFTRNVSSVSEDFGETRDGAANESRRELRALSASADHGHRDRAGFRRGKGSSRCRFQIPHRTLWTRARQVRHALSAIPSGELKNIPCLFFIS